MGRGERGKRWGSGGRGWGGGDGNGERDTGRWAARRGRWGRGISQMDIMKYLGEHTECLDGMRLESFLTLFTRATPGTPASKEIKQKLLDQYHHLTHAPCEVLVLIQILLFHRFISQFLSMLGF